MVRKAMNGEFKEIVNLARIAMNFGYDADGAVRKATW